MAHFGLETGQAQFVLSPPFFEVDRHPGCDVHQCQVRRASPLPCSLPLVLRTQGEIWGLAGEKLNVRPGIPWGSARNGTEITYLRTKSGSGLMMEVNPLQVLCTTLR